MALLSDKIAQAQTENARQLGAMADSFKEQMNQMFQLISGQIANLSAGVPAPVGDPVSDIEQHRRDNSYHVQDGSDKYTDEEWKKWYDRDDEPGYDDGRERSPRGGAKAPLLPVVPKKSVVED